VTWKSSGGLARMTPVNVPNRNVTRKPIENGMEVFRTSWQRLGHDPEERQGQEVHLGMTKNQNRCCDKIAS
jgi:hypothetical protein